MPTLSKTDVKRLLGFSLEQIGGVVFPYIGSITVPQIETNLSYDANDRRQIASQKFIYEGKEYEISYSNYTRDKNGRLSGYEAHVKKAG